MFQLVFSFILAFFDSLSFFSRELLVKMDPDMKAAIDAQVQAMVTLELEKQKDKQTIELTRKLRIDQKKAAFKNASDKRAIGFLYDVKFDMEDFLAKFKKVIDEDDNVVDVRNNVENVKKFLDFCTGFGNMFNRKINKEIEAYEVAKTSKFGWLAEKYYRQSEVFNDFDPEKQPWFERQEPSADEKVKKLRQAEKQAAFASRQKKPFGQKFDNRGRKRSRWGPENSASSSTAAAAAGAPASSVSSNDVKFGPQKLYQPPGGHGCHFCGEFGHYIRNCPKKSAKN